MSKILFLNNSKYFGGTDTFLFELIAHWPNSDVKILSVNRSHEAIDRYLDFVKVTKDCELNTYPFYSIHELSFWAKKIPLPRLLLKLIVFILYSVQLVFSFFYFALYLFIYKPQTIISSSGGYPVNEYNLVILLVGKLFFISKRILILHTVPTSDEMLLINKFYLSVSNFLTNFSSSTIVSVSKYAASDIQKNLKNKNGVKYIYNGINANFNSDPNSRKKLLSLGAKEGFQWIGLIGNFTEQRGQINYLKAFKKVIDIYPNVQLIMIGKGNGLFWEKCLNYIKEESIEENVLVTGYLPNASLFIPNFDFLVLPTLRSESFGMVVLEAWRNCKTIIASTAGSLTEIVDDNINGYTIDPLDIDSFAEKTLYLLQNKEVRQSLGIEGNKTLVSKFSSEIMVKNYQEVVEE